MSGLNPGLQAEREMWRAFLILQRSMKHFLKNISSTLGWTIQIQSSIKYSTGKNKNQPVKKTACEAAHFRCHNSKGLFPAKKTVKEGQWASQAQVFQGGGVATEKALLLMQATLAFLRDLTFLSVCEWFCWQKPAGFLPGIFLFIGCSQW